MRFTPRPLVTAVGLASSNLLKLIGRKRCVVGPMSVRVDKVESDVLSGLGRLLRPAEWRWRGRSASQQGVGGASCSGIPGVEACGGVEGAASWIAGFWAATRAR